MSGCLMVIGGLMTLTVLVCSIGFVMWSRAAANRVEDQLAKLRADGQPTTPDELHAYYPYPPEHEDVTSLILAAIRELDTPAFEAAAVNLPLVGKSDEEIPPPGQPWDKRDAARELLERYNEPLRQLQEAAETGGAARFPVRFEDGVGVLLEHAQQMRAAAKLLALEAHVRAHGGDSRGAARSILALLSLARSIENEPQLISQMVGYACHQVAHGATAELLPHVDFADEDLVMLQRELRRAEIADGMRRGLVGERAIGIYTKMGDSEAFDDAAGSAGSLKIATNEDFSLYLETMSRYIEAAEQPWPEARKRVAQVERDFQSIAAGSPLQQLRYMMSNLLLTPVEVLIVAGARIEAGRHVVDTAIAVERYRRKHNQPPQGIEALVSQYLPAVPSDPFDGQPLRYVLENDEIVIYSIGVDEHDDRGQGDLGGDPDIVIRLPR